jgi:hypothetical protein
MAILQKWEKMEQTMEHMLAKIYTIQVKMVSHHEEIMADMRARRKEMKADREAMEPYPDKLEVNSEEETSVVVHEEVPKEEAQ